MSLKDIVVHLDRKPGCTARVLVAADLARQHGACLKGLYVVSHQYYTPDSDYDGDYDEARGFFLNTTSKSGVTAEWLFADWGVVGVSASDIILFHSHATDLLIIGQPDADRPVRRRDYELPERLIIGSGRPVVIVPADGSTFKFGSRILVAWKGGRESCRALHDALPLMKDASRVDIVAVVSGEEERAWETTSLAALDAYLERKALVTSSRVIERGNRSVADVIQRQIEEEGFDLVVMGGCSHDWLGAPVFNHVGRELLNRMTVPILFSH
jgi:nucleotide-binding universal stress UspA family protein